MICKIDMVILSFDPAHRGPGHSYGVITFQKKYRLEWVRKEFKDLVDDELWDKWMQYYKG